MKRQTFEEAKREETQRILDYIRELSAKEKHVYMRGYGDALEYAYKFFSLRNAGDTLEEHLP